VTFIDFERAFDSVKREIMWLTLQEYGIPRKIIQIIKILFDGFKCRIAHEGKLSYFIEIRNGVRQGCILSPTLVLLILDRSIKRVKGLRKRGIHRSMKERLKDLDYADDICLLAHRFCDMKEKLKRLKEEGELAGLQININKTKVMRVNTSNMQKVGLGEAEIEEVGSFVYLGSVVSEGGGTEEDVASRIKKANGVFLQLYPVWRNLIISKEVKIRIFNTNVKSLLLYACQTWKTTNQITRRLQIFLNKSLRRIMNIKWTDKIKNEELWRITHQNSTENQIKRRKWNWIGHTLRKEAGAIEKTALDWNPQGCRSRGRPKRTW